jgi:hypothetical protein
MLLGAFELTGFLLALVLGGGLVFAILGVWLRRRGLKEGEQDSGMTLLQLNNY